MSTAAQNDAVKSPAAQGQDSVIIVAYPKIIFLYPTFVAAVLGAVTMSFVDAGSVAASVTGWLFLFVLATNAAVISFDFPRATSLTLFFVGVALVLSLVLAVVYFPDVLPAVTGWLSGFRPVANATFYGVLASTLGVIYAFVLINRRFDYWEVRPNELLHHHGLLSDLERYSAPNMRIDKEINDVFEYILLGAGRLIIHPSNERRAIVLENVCRISSKEKSITRMLSALQVSVRGEG